MKQTEWYAKQAYDKSVENTSQLAETATKADTASAKADAMSSGSPKGVYTTLTALQTAFPTGATGAYLVTADGKWYYWNGSAWTIGGTYQSAGIADGSVTLSKTSFAFKTINLIDSESINFWVQEANYGIRSIPITLLLDTYYTFKFSSSAFDAYCPIRQVYFYNAGGTELGHIDLNLVSGQSVKFKILSATYPTFAYAKIYISTNDGAKSISPTTFVNYITKMQLELGEIATTYNSYYRLKADIRLEDLPYIPLSEFDFSKLTINIVGSFYSGYALDTNSGVMIYYANGLCSKDYIPVDATLNYYLSHAFVVACYNSSKVFLGVVNINNSQYVSGIIRFLAGTAYVMLASFGARTLTDKVMFTQSDFTVDYKMPTSSIIPKEYLEINSPAKSWWCGRKLCTQGDSLTANGIYQPYLVNKYGFILTNIGIGGTYVGGVSADAMWQDVRVNAIPLDTEVLLLMGGANDYMGTPIGVVTDTTTTTFYGAYQTMLDKIYARIPNAIVILAQIPWNANDGNLNANGNTNQDFRDAIEVISKKYGYALVDTLRVGINKLNKTTYLADGVHQNALGGAKLASAFIGKLKEIEPIT